MTTKDRMKRTKTQPLIIITAKVKEIKKKDKKGIVIIEQREIMREILKI
jgi:hypothetical protein